MCWEYQIPRECNSSILPDFRIFRVSADELGQSIQFNERLSLLRFPEFASLIGICLLSVVQPSFSLPKASVPAEHSIHEVPVLKNRWFLLGLLLLPVFGWAQNDSIKQGRFSLEKMSYKGSEGHGEEVVIIRSHGSDGAASVLLRVVGGSAVAGEDFLAPAELIHFESGQAEKAVVFQILKDKVLELPETLYLELSEPSDGAILGDTPKARLQIVMINNDAVVLGMLFTILGLVFATTCSTRPAIQTFYKYVPSLLLCYFLPSILSTFGIVSAHHSNLYFVASRYLLPTCLVLLCLSIDLKGILKLGPKALIMFLTGTAGIVFGGPLALLLVSWVSPETVGGEGANAVWRGMTTVAGSWIGGGANQAAMKEVWQVGGQIFSATVTVDIIVASLWMAVLLLMAGESDKIDNILGADNSAIKALQKKLALHQKQTAKIPTLNDLMKFTGAGFTVTAMAHFFADIIGPYVGDNFPLLKKLNLDSSFFWLVVTSTCSGLLLSFTSARKWEGVGASRLGSAFLYLLVATIGMEMDLMAIFQQPGLFVVGTIWISIHGILLFTVAKLIKAPLFFIAVGSQANVGGAASAPIVASAFHPTLAPVGVMLAVFGYFLGTFGAWLCGLLMQAAVG